MRTLFTIAGCAVVVAALGFVAFRVSVHQDSERDVFGEPQTAAEVALIRPRHELVAASLQAGQTASFELCVDAPLHAPLTVEVWHRGDGARVTSEELDLAEINARLEDQPEGACDAMPPLQLRVSGEYALAVNWAEGPAPPSEELANVRLRGHIMGVTPIAKSEKLAVLFALLAALVALLAQLFAVASSSELPDELRKPPRAPHVTIAFAVGGLFAVMFAIAFLPLRGALGGFVSGVSLAVTQLVAIALLTRDRERLALSRSKWIVAAPVIGVAIFVAGRVVSALVPATGVAPIESLVAWPSGMLGVAVIAVVVPIVEELFFRGLVYGALAEKSEGLAVVLTIAVFALAHLPQQWGAWGAFASVLLTGVVLTLLRRVSGSTIVCAVAHLAHNAIITWFALGWASSG